MRICIVIFLIAIHSVCFSQKYKTKSQPFSFLNYPKYDILADFKTYNASLSFNQKLELKVIIDKAHKTIYEQNVSTAIANSDLINLKHYQFVELNSDFKINYTPIESYIYTHHPTASLSAEESKKFDMGTAYLTHFKGVATFKLSIETKSTTINDTIALNFFIAPLMDRMGNVAKTGSETGGNALIIGDKANVLNNLTPIYLKKLYNELKKHSEQIFERTVTEKYIDIAFLKKFEELNCDELEADAETIQDILKKETDYQAINSLFKPYTIKWENLFEKYKNQNNWASVYALNNLIISDVYSNQYSKALEKSELIENYINQMGETKWYHRTSNTWNNLYPLIKTDLKTSIAYQKFDFESNYYLSNKELLDKKLNLEPKKTEEVKEYVEASITLTDGNTYKANVGLNSIELLENDGIVSRPGLLSLDGPNITYIVVQFLVPNPLKTQGKYLFINKKDFTAIDIQGQKYNVIDVEVHKGKKTRKCISQFSHTKDEISYYKLKGKFAGNICFKAPNDLYFKIQ